MYFLFCFILVWRLQNAIRLYPFNYMIKAVFCFAVCFSYGHVYCLFFFSFPGGREIKSLDAAILWPLINSLKV